MYSSYFLIGQSIIIFLFAFMHFLIGYKRGFKKTVWYTVGYISVSVLVLYLIGLIPVHWFISDEMVRSVAIQISNSFPEFAEQMEILFDSGFTIIVKAVVDLVGKIGLYILLYVLFRWIWMILLVGMPFKRIMNRNDDYEATHKFLGGMIGSFRGVITGLLIMLPILVLTNTALKSDRILKNEEKYDSMIVDLHKANQVNFVRYANMVKIGHIGLADTLFDLAFSTNINNETIQWRNEISWAVEGYFISTSIDTESENFNFTKEDLETFKHFFDDLSHSGLINIASKPGLKMAVSMVEDKRLPSNMKSEFISELDKIDFKINKDFNALFEALDLLLTVRDYQSWQSVIDKPDLMTEFNEEEKNSIKLALEKIPTLELFKLADLSLKTYLNLPETMDLLVWHDTDASKKSSIDYLVDKINDSDNGYVSALISDVLNLSFEILDFKNIIKDGNEITLNDLITNQVNFLSIDDPEYHQWIAGLTESLFDSKLIQDLTPELLNYTTYLIENELTTFDEEEITTLTTILSTQLASGSDLKREIVWLTDVYKELTLFYSQKETESSETIDIIDSVLIKSEGRDAFNSLINTALEGRLLGDLTSNLSNALVKKYVTEPLSIAEPLHRGIETESYSFEKEIHTIKNIILDLYEQEGFTLSIILGNGADAVQVVPYLLEYAKDDDAIDAMLKSEIIYSFIDYQLNNIESINIPDFVKSPEKGYHDYISKSEIKNIFEILAAPELDVKAIFNELDNNQSLLIENLLKYAKEEVNQDKILSSGIIYYTISEILKEQENLIPETAIVSDESSIYINMIERSEIKNLLSTLSILNVTNINSEESLIDIKNITNEQLTEIAKLGSLTVRRQVTNELNKVTSLKKPLTAYETIEKLDLNQKDLLAIVEMINILDISVSELTDIDQSSDILSSIKLSDFLVINHDNSSMIRSFITYGIESAELEIPEYAYDSISTEDDILSSNEIYAIFSAIQILKKSDEQTLNDLTVNLSVDSITFADAEQLSTNQSFMILNMVSKEVLKTELISLKLDLVQESIYHDDKETMLTFDEYGKLIESLLELSNEPSELLMQTLNSFEAKNLTMIQAINMFDKSSHLVHVLISSELEKIGVPQYVKDRKLIGSMHITDLLSSLSNLGNEKTMTEIENLKDDMTIDDLEKITTDSIIIKYVFTKQIEQHIGSPKRTTLQDYSYIQSSEYDREHLNDSEITALVESLKVLSDDKTEAKIIDVVAMIDNTLSIETIIRTLDKNSSIVRARISDELIFSIGDQRVHIDVIDEHHNILNEDLKLALNGLVESFGHDTNIESLTNINEKLSLTVAKKLSLYESKLIHGLISSYMFDNIETQTRTIKENALDSYTNSSDIYIKKLISRYEIITLLTSVEMLSMIDSQTRIDELNDDMKADNMTFGDLNAIKDTNSSILKTLLSEILIETVEEKRIHKNAYDQDYGDELSKIEISSLLSAMNQIKESDDEMILSRMNTFEAQSDTLSIKKFIKMHEENSLIIRKYISEGILRSFSRTPSDETKYQFKSIYSIYETDSNIEQLLTYIEITNLLNILDDIYPSSSIDAFSNVIHIPLQKIGEHLEYGDSLIFHRIVTTSLADANLLTDESIQDTNSETSLFVQIEEVINLINFSTSLEILTIDDVENTKSTDLFLLLQDESKMDRSSFIEYIDNPEQSEYEGKTIVKDYLINKLELLLISNGEERSRKGLINIYDGIINRKVE